MIFWVLFIALFIALTIAGCVFTYVRWRRHDGDDLWQIAGFLSICGVFLSLLLLAMSTGGVTSLADGCYRVSSTTSVGVVSTGKTVTPVVLSGKNYTPIECP